MYVNGQIKRHKGFVIGKDMVKRRVVWKVRVKDIESEYNRKKFFVASIHQGIELAQGLNVNFVIGSINSKKGGFLCAVDVRLDE